jgi:2-oxoglutarate decarboxylase
VRRGQHDGGDAVDAGELLPPAAPAGLAGHRAADRVHAQVDAATSGSFQKVLPDPAALPAQAVSRVILASGKVIYDLEAERARRADRTTAILRVEQLAPLAADEIAAAIKGYPGAEIMWVQDEPVNQGAWPFMAMNLPQALAERGETRQLRVASREASASPATGSSKKHALQQAQLIAEAFDR